MLALVVSLLILAVARSHDHCMVCDERLQFYPKLSAFHQPVSPTDCIPVDWICDGESDCSEDNPVDELNCDGTCWSCETFIGADPPKFSCFAFNWMCDGEQQCINNADEAYCGGPEQCVSDGDCTSSRDCIGGHCECPEGLLDPGDNTCNNVNECNNNPCAEDHTFCIDTRGSYVCSCWPNYLSDNPEFASCIREDAIANPLAITGSASSGMRWDFTGPEKLHDGGVNTDLTQGDCFLDLGGGGLKWAEVYLDDTYIIAEVEILNRADSQTGVIRNTEVYACIDNNEVNNANCVYFGEVHQNNPVDVDGKWIKIDAQVEPIFANTIRIERNGVLQACEILVRGYLDQCLAGRCAELAECRNSGDGEYEFYCPDGFSSPNAQDVPCSDDNECLESNACKLKSTCVNTLGDYECICDDGYFSPDPKTFDCVDNNECDEALNLCAALAICTNQFGDFHCVCPDGFVSNNPKTEDCQDINECLDDPCAANTVCINTLGSFECECLPGYDSDDPRTEDCFYIDECNWDPFPCGLHAICSNTPGEYGFTCACPSDRESVDSDTNECFPIDNCGPSSCPANTDCTTVQYSYSYECACKDGFESHNPFQQDCTPIDNCDDDSCADHAICTTVPFSVDVTCDCKPNYESPDANTIDCTPKVPQCEDFTDPCAEFAICINLPDGYKCECIEGFVSANPQTEDCAFVDEIKENEKWKEINKTEAESDCDRSVIFSCELPSCEHNDYGANLTCNNDQLTTLTATDNDQCAYTCGSFASGRCAPRRWVECDFVIPKDDTMICYPLCNSGIIRSGCLGSCRSITSYDPFSQYKSKGCNCCTTARAAIDEIVLKCFPIDMETIDDVFCKYFKYRYPVAVACECDECQDIGYNSKVADFDMIKPEEADFP